MFLKIDVLKNTCNSQENTRKHLCKRSTTLKQTPTMVLYVGFAKFLRKPILHNTLHKKRNFILNIFSENVTKLQFPTFTEGILNRKLHVLCIDTSSGCFWFFQIFLMALKQFPGFIRFHFYNVLRALFFKIYTTCNSARNFLDLICPHRYFAQDYLRRGQKIINLGRRIINFKVCILAILDMYNKNEFS